jgi:pilus assembly protein Flp/PilA
MALGSSVQFGVMMKFQLRVRQFLHNEDGPTAVEYAVMLALIVAVCIGAVQILAVATRDNFNTSAQAIDNAF